MVFAHTLCYFMQRAPSGPAFLLERRGTLQSPGAPLLTKKSTGPSLLMEPEILMFSYELGEGTPRGPGAGSGVPEASFHFFGYCIITSKFLVTNRDQNF